MLNVFFGLLVFEAQTTAVTQSKFKWHGGCLPSFMSTLALHWLTPGLRWRHGNNFNNGINLFRSNHEKIQFRMRQKHGINMKTRMITFNQFPDQIFRFIRRRICYFNLLLTPDIVTPFFERSFSQSLFLVWTSLRRVFHSQDCTGCDGVSMLWAEKTSPGNCRCLQGNEKCKIKETESKTKQTLDFCVIFVLEASRV